mmetsp:Transcript_76781/g.222915  ORF Transcript_76781/g.222915 Transcript_76781/m.222915 type:complete len:507 (+) Transcript_76781:266-1786(+)
MCGCEVVAVGQGAFGRLPSRWAQLGVGGEGLLGLGIPLNEDGVDVLIEPDLPRPPLGVAQAHTQLACRRIVEEAVVVYDHEVVCKLPPSVHDPLLRLHLPVGQQLQALLFCLRLDVAHLDGKLVLQLGSERPQEVLRGVSPVRRRRPIGHEVEGPKGGRPRELQQGALGVGRRHAAARRRVERDVDRCRRGVRREPHHRLPGLRRPALADDGVRGPGDRDAPRDLAERRRRAPALDAEGVAERAREDALSEVELGAFIQVAEKAEHFPVLQQVLDLHGHRQLQWIDGQARVAVHLRSGDLRQPPLSQGRVERDRRLSRRRLERDNIWREDLGEVQRLLPVPKPRCSCDIPQVRREEPTVAWSLWHLAQYEVVRDERRVPRRQAHCDPCGLADTRDAADDVEDPSLTQAVRHRDGLAAVIEGDLAVRLNAQAPLSDHRVKAVLVGQRAHCLHGAARSRAPLHGELHEVRQVDEPLGGCPAEARVAGYRCPTNGVVHQPGWATRFAHR